MGQAYGPSIIKEGLRVLLDVGTAKGVSGTSLVNLVQNEQPTGSVGTAEDSIAGNCIDLGTSAYMPVVFDTPINHEQWTLIWYARSTGVAPASDYRVIMRLVESTYGSYFYNIDSRQTINTYQLGYQKDEAVSSWLTHNWGILEPAWLTQEWHCFATTHNNKTFKTYIDGIPYATQVQGLNVDTYGDLTQLQINNSAGNNVVLGPVMLYERVLSDADIYTNFLAAKGRFGL